jgi:GxxExxY protein
VLNTVDPSTKPSFDLSYEVIGACMRVHNELGPGLREKPYENALAVEFEELGIRFEQQPVFPIFYHGRAVGECIPDFSIQRETLIDSLGENERAQMLNYLRITRYGLGLVVNFKNARLEWERLVL